MSWTHFTMFLLGAIPTVATTEAMAAPKELIGKSIIVTWTEEWMARPLSSSVFHHEIRHDEFSVYVSTLSRVFNRLKIANGRGKSGFVEEVGGKISFPAKSIVAVQTQERGARRITVTFDHAYSSCTAQVIHGKAAGVPTMLGEGIISGGTQERHEIESTHVSGASCSIKEGNVFGD